MQYTKLNTDFEKKNKTNNFPVLSIKKTKIDVK